MKFLEKVKYIKEFNKKRFIYEGIYCFIEYLEYILVGCLYLKWIVTDVQSGKELSYILKKILGFTVILFLIFIIRSYINNVVRPITTIDIYSKVYGQIYNKASQVELECFENEKFYNKYMLVLDKADEKLINVIKNAYDIFFGSIAVIATFIIMYRMDKFLIFFVFVPLLSNFTIGVLYNKISFDREKEIISQKRRIDCTDSILKLKNYANDIRTTNLFELLCYNYEESVAKIKKIVKKFFLKTFSLNFVNVILSFSIFSLLFTYAAFRTIVSKTMTKADLAVILTVASVSSFIIIKITYVFSDIVKNLLFVQNLIEFLNYESKINENQQGITPDKNVRSIEFKNVSFGYNSDSELLHNISFVIKGNSKVGLVGKNGEGKTTLLKLLFRLYDPTSGQILVNGVDIKKYNLKEYRKLFASVMQDYQLFALPIEDNIKLCRDVEITVQNFNEILEYALISEKINELPKRAKTIMTREFDDDGIDSSGGQKQKLAIARTFASSAFVKVFDEPTSAVDPISEQRMLENICNQNNDGITILITHRLSLLVDFNQILVLNEGIIVEDGNHKELMEMNGIYKEMYMRQAQNYIDGMEVV